MTYGHKAMGPGRFELPTSRLSGVRSKPTELRAQEPATREIRRFFFNKNFLSEFPYGLSPKVEGSSVITINLKKSNKKTAVKTASGPKTQRLLVAFRQFRL
jgi:hypothetical protein